MGADHDSIRFTAGLTDSFINGNKDNDTIIVANDATTSTLEGGQGARLYPRSQDATSVLVQGRLGNDIIRWWVRPPAPPSTATKMTTP